jgi:hypothetical protein
LALTAVKSGAVTTTVSLHPLLASLVSWITFCGSTEHVPPLRGFANVPG